MSNKYLDRSMFGRYREELSLFAPEDFHIGPIESSRKAYVRICCGGSTGARLEGFAEMFGAGVYTVGDGFAASASLIGYMQAQMIILFFEDAEDYRKWVDDGVELDFLQYNDNSEKTFAVSCPDRLDLDALSELIGAEVTTDLDWRNVQGAKLKPNSYIDSMVMVPTGTAPYQVEPIVVPQDARGMEFSGYITNTEGCDVGGAVFYGCQRRVDGAVNIAVGEGYESSNIRRPLLVSQSEITQALYESIMGANPSEFKGSGELPVEQVSWFDLLEFCNRLSAIQGFRPCYTIDGEDVEWDRSADGYRLPTEHEWEYIARANRGFEYSGSDDVDAVAWHQYGDWDPWDEDQFEEFMHDVGMKKENSFGTYDQSGNVWERCWDLYAGGDAQLRDGWAAMAVRVWRGGSYLDDAERTSSAFRGKGVVVNREEGTGGRLVRSPDLP